MKISIAPLQWLLKHNEAVYFAVISVRNHSSGLTTIRIIALLYF